MLQRPLAVAAILWLSVSVNLFAQEKAQFAGPTDKGYLLPNGWTISPAGQQVTLTDLPLNIVPLRDGKHALVASSGFNKHQICLIDLAKREIVASGQAHQSWFGLAVSPSEDKVWWSGGGAGMLHTFDLKNNQLARTNVSPGSAPPPPSRDNSKILGREAMIVFLFGPRFPAPDLSVCRWGHSATRKIHAHPHSPPACCAW